MAHAVAGIVAHVEHQAIAPVRQALGRGHFVGQDEHVAQDLLVFGPQRGSIVDMTPGDYENVGGRDRVQIPEGGGMIRSRDLVGGDIAGGDTTEDAVGHTGANVLRDDAAARFLADARNIESARARAREHWIRQQAREGATFEGVLRALSERGALVEIVTIDSGCTTGQIMTISAELVAVGADDVPLSWVITRKIATVRPMSQSGDAGVASDDREADSSATLAGLLANLADERAEVNLRCGGRDVSGRLAGSGTDVVTVRGRSGELSYLPIDALTVVRLG